MKRWFILLTLCAVAPNLFGQELKCFKDFYNRCGFKNAKGEVVIACQYEDAAPFFDGYAAVKLNNKWGYINANGEQVIACKYEKALPLREGLAPVRFGGKWGYINTLSETVVNFVYDGASIFSEGSAAVRVGDKWGYINRQGEQVIACQYERTSFFFQGFAPVMLNRKWGYIDKNGEQITQFKYDEAEPFVQGAATVRLDGKRMWININGDEFVSKNEAKSCYARFSYFARKYVENKINEWQQKGEFEKTSDWQARVSEQSRSKKIEEFARQAEQEYIAEHSGDIKTSYTLERYDADNETYLVRGGGKDMLVPVPMSDAQYFKDNWGRIEKKPKYFIENDLIAIAEVSFVAPNGKTYKYSNDASLNYTVAQIDYNFAPIEIQSANVSSKPNGSQSIFTANVVVGRADVDSNIPQTGKVNSNTFAVIIANENYLRLAKVPHAINDGKTFGNYCHKTLGLPESNIRFYDNATYGVMRAAIKDITKIAEAYDGNLSVIFYYAGHGAPDEGTQAAYLLPVDAFGVDSETCYSLTKLYGDLSMLGAKDVTVFLDACFSGTTREGSMLASARGVAIKPKTEVPMGNVVVFSAASSNETALPYNDKGHGLFTYFLLKKLQESQGEVTLGELSEYISQNVRQQSVVVNRKPQTPTVCPSPSIASGWKSLKLK